MERGREILGEPADISGRLTESRVTGVSTPRGFSGSVSLNVLSVSGRPLSLEIPEPITVAGGNARQNVTVKRVGEKMTKRTKKLALALDSNDVDKFVNGRWLRSKTQE